MSMLNGVVICAVGRLGGRHRLAVVGDACQPPTSEFRMFLGVCLVQSRHRKAMLIVPSDIRTTTAGAALADRDRADVARRTGDRPVGTPVGLASGEDRTDDGHVG